MTRAETEALVRQAATTLRREGATQVFVFGSAARGGARAGSDVDLAVAGLPPGRFYRAVGVARRVLRREVDLVDLDEGGPFAEYLMASGEMLHVG